MAEGMDGNSAVGKDVLDGIPRLGDITSDAAVEVAQEDFPGTERSPDTAEEPQATPEADSAPEEEKEPVLCPRCGNDIDNAYQSTLTADDIQGYYASILTAEPFEKTYEMLGGMLHVTFRDMHGWEREDLERRYCAETTTAGSFQHAVSQRQYTLKMGFSLVCASLQDFEGNRKHVLQFDRVQSAVLEKFKDDREAYLCDETLREFHHNPECKPFTKDAVVAAIYEAHREFDQMMMDILVRATSPDFLKTIPTAG
jgi:hypothetical protein